jgi:hypothetical protein
VGAGVGGGGVGVDGGGVVDELTVHVNDCDEDSTPSETPAVTV